MKCNTSLVIENNFNIIIVGYVQSLVRILLWCGTFSSKYRLQEHRITSLNCFYLTLDAKNVKGFAGVLTLFKLDLACNAFFQTSSFICSLMNVAFIAFLLVLHIISKSNLWTRTVILPLGFLPILHCHHRIQYLYITTATKMSNRIFQNFTSYLLRKDDAPCCIPWNCHC